MTYRYVEGKPLRPVGGRVLERATLAALNRVPGREGRYCVTLMGPDIVMLSEFLQSGQAPIALFAPGLVYFAAYGRGWGRGLRYQGQGGLPSMPEVQAGFPFKRQVAVLWFLCESIPAVTWTPEYETGQIDGGGLLTGVCYSFLRPGERPPLRNYRGVGGFLGINDVTAATYCGSRPVSTGAITDLVYDVCAALEEWQVRARSGSPQAVRGAWSRLVSCFTPAIDGSPPDVLSGVGLWPEVWSSQTDPGGQGDPCGEEDGDLDRDDDDEYDEDQEYDDDGQPVPRARRIRGPAAHVVQRPASSFAQWEDAQIGAGRVRAIPRVGQARRTELAPPPYDHASEMCQCEDCREGADPAAIAGPYP